MQVSEKPNPYQFKIGVLYEEFGCDAKGRPVYKEIGSAPTTQRRGHGRGASLADMGARLAQLERPTSANPMSRAGMEIARMEAALKGR